MSEVPVTTEWALWGKRSNDRGYRLLECSDGAVGAGAFTEAITRYSPGALERLPQVTVNWLRLHGHGDYVAMAIHDTGDDQHDAVGRKIVFTRYFCTPYRQLAAGAVSYQSMYDAFVKLRPWLRDGDRSSLPITLPDFSGSQAGQARELAVRVAGLLLTGRPVCVLHGDLLDLDERLRFIDSVMALLPYGMRSEMSASTWASSTATEHKLRLFFAGARRPGDDHVVLWDRPDNGKVGHRYADDYLAWLADCEQNPEAKLAVMDSPVGFKPRDVLTMLERLHVSYDTRPGQLAIEPPRPPAPVVRLPAIGSAPRTGAEAENVAESAASSAETVELSGAVTVSAARPEMLPDLLPAMRSDPYPPPERDPSIEEILRGFGRRLAYGDPVILRPDMNRLHTILKHPVEAEDRPRYQQIIHETGLLRPGRPIDKDLQPEFYRLLLRLAFDTPLTYQDYRVVEECAGPELPQPLLAELANVEPADLRVILLIAHAHGERTLRQKLHMLRPAPSVLIEAASSLELSIEHGRVLSGIVISELDKAELLDRMEVQDALARHGSLAPALSRLYPRQHERQLDQLKRLLQLAYGSTLDRRAALYVLDTSGHPPTPALYAAVLSMIDRNDIAAAERSFSRGVLGNAGFDRRTRDELLYRLPVPKPDPALPVSGGGARYPAGRPEPERRARPRLRRRHGDRERPSRSRSDLQLPGSLWLLLVILLSVVVMLAIIRLVGQY